MFERSIASGPAEGNCKPDNNLMNGVWTVNGCVASRGWISPVFAVMVIGAMTVFRLTDDTPSSLKR